MKQHNKTTNAKSEDNETILQLRGIETHPRPDKPLTLWH